MSGWDWLKEGAGAAESCVGAGPAVVVPRVERGSGSSWWRGTTTTTNAPRTSTTGARDASPPSSLPQEPKSTFGSHNSPVQAPVPAILLGEAMPSQLTVEFLAAKYGDKVLPLEINSPKQTNVRLADWLLFPKEDPKNKLYAISPSPNHFVVQNASILLLCIACAVQQYSIRCGSSRLFFHAADTCTNVC